MKLKTYFKESSHPFYGAITALGMLVLYEIFLVWEPDVPILYRNAPEAWMRGVLHFFGLSHHYVSFFWITIGLLAIPLLHKKGMVFSHKLYFFLTAEAILWGLLSGVILDLVVYNLLMAQSSLTGHLLSDLALAIGAGLFEELFFRVGLTSLLILGFSKIFSWRPMALFMSILIASFLFSLAHYTGSGGDQFTLYSFMFRFFAGFWFTTLYAVRGFAVVALTHAFYDIFIILG